MLPRILELFVFLYLCVFVCMPCMHKCLRRWWGIRSFEAEVVDFWVPLWRWWGVRSFEAGVVDFWVPDFWIDGNSNQVLWKRANLHAVIFFQLQVPEYSTRNWRIFVFLVFETRSCFCTHSGIEDKMLLPDPPQSWDYRYAPPFSD